MRNSKRKEIYFGYIPNIPPFLLGFGGVLLFCSVLFHFWRDVSIVFRMLLFMAEIIDRFPGKRGSQEPQKVTQRVLMYSVARSFSQERNCC